MARLWHGLNGLGRDSWLRDGTRYRVSEKRVDTSRRVLVETLNRVQINARCDRRRLMSKGARDGLQVDARCKRQRPERMAEIVESDVWKLRAFDEPGERKRKRARLPRRAAWTRKDPTAFVSFYPARLAELLTVVLFAEDLSDKWRQRDRPRAARGFRRLRARDAFDGLERAMNREPTRVEVDVGPAQREQLTTPQAGTDCDSDDRLQFSPLRGP